MTRGDGSGGESICTSSSSSASSSSWACIVSIPTSSKVLMTPTTSPNRLHHMTDTPPPLPPFNTDGGTLPDPKPPHQPHTYGSLSYASSSSKNSSTSQFFITLAPNTPAGIAERKKKLDNKYYPFGQLVSEDEAVLRRLEERLGGQVGWDGMAGRGERCWVAECGVC